MTVILALVTLFAQAPATVNNDYIVGPQDVLEIIVHGHDEMTTPRAVVDSDGTIDFPTLGRVVVAGRSPRDIEEDLKKRLIEKQILTKVSMTVSVKEFRSQTVHVMGQVRAPGIYPIKGGASMVATAIAEAGSFLDNAGSYLIVVRNRSGNPDSPTPIDSAAETDKLVIQRSDLEEARPNSRIPLRNGDTIYVPKAQTFYVSGQVKTPNEYVLRPNLTVGQAVTLAGGYTDRASKNPEIHRVVNGKLVKKKVKESELVQPGDTVYIPSRWW